MILIFFSSCLYAAVRSQSVLFLSKCLANGARIPVFVMILNVLFLVVCVIDVTSYILSPYTSIPPLVIVVRNVSNGYLFHRSVYHRHLIVLCSDNGRPFCFCSLMFISDNVCHLSLISTPIMLIFRVSIS